MIAIESTATAPPSPTDTSHNFTLRCKKCRTSLASSTELLTHEPGQVPHTSFRRRFKESRKISLNPGPVADPCHLLFLDASVQWLPSSVGQANAHMTSQIESRLDCPHCQTKLGFWSWSGMACSCGQWVTPAFTVSKDRVDKSVIPKN